MALSLVTWLLIGLALQVVAYLLKPRPKKQKPPEAQDLDDPTAEAGRPVPVVFGSLTVSGLNVLWYGDKRVYQYIKNQSKKSRKKSD